MHSISDIINGLVSDYSISVANVDDTDSTFCQKLSLVCCHLLCPCYIFRAPREVSDVSNIPRGRQASTSRQTDGVPLAKVPLNICANTGQFLYFDIVMWLKMASYVK